MYLDRTEQPSFFHNRTLTYPRSTVYTLVAVGKLQFDSGRHKHWLDLAALDPKEVGDRTGVSWREGRYHLPFLGTSYPIDCESMHIHCLADDPLAEDPEFELLMLIYLLRATEIEPSGKWVNEKQLPGGSNFFR